MAGLIVDQLPPANRSTVTPAEALIVALMCFGWSMLSSLQTYEGGYSSGTTFDDWTLINIIITEFIAGGATLIFLRLRGFDLRLLIPQPTLAGSIQGAVVYLGVLAVHYAVWGLFSPATVADNRDQVAIAAINPLISLAVSCINGWFEEAFLLGVLVRGLRQYGLSVAVGVPLLIRIGYHIYQGPLGVVSVAVFGLAVTLAFIRKGQLWPAVFAHALGDFVALA